MKKTFPKLLLLLSLVLTVNSFTYSQPTNFNPTAYADSQLRALFSPLWHPVPGPGFLHDMAVHILDSTYFDVTCNDTLNRDTWFKLYEEMRNCAYDTTQMITFDSVFTLDMTFQKDTVVMNILAYDYLMFNDSALSSNHYYTADTVNNLLIENGSPGELNPYLTYSVFASCPGIYYLPYKTIVYRIDPALIFHDTYNDFVANNWEIQIDFGDGAGWQHFNAGVVTHYTATYNTPGITHITTQVVDLGTASVIKCSMAEVSASSREKPTPAYKRIENDGIIADVWEPCSESGEPFKKMLIYIEGLDLGDAYLGMDRDANDIYAEQIMKYHIDELRNFGYSIAIINWKSSRIDIKTNAQYFSEILDSFKCEQMIVADTGTHEQFVIIAESMGGLVARYAMCDYEQNWNTKGLCLKEKMHNTRLLITLDSPHEGANIPVALQALYRQSTRFLAGASVLTQWLGSRIYNQMLDAKSARQMLLYHIDTYNPFNHNINQHQNKTDFDNDLYNIGDFPEYCKLVALGNGSISGRGQTHFYDIQERTPNDYLLDFQRDHFGRMFRTDIQLLGTNFKLRTTPNGSGNVVENSVDFYRPFIKIQIKNWKLTVRVTSTYFFTLNDKIDVNNIEPYDVIPGSHTDMNESLITNNYEPTNSAYLLLFGLHRPTYSFTNNAWTVRSFVGGGAFATWQNMYMYTDGMHWCFIPTFSSLNYSVGSDYWANIENHTMGTKLNNTPFDMIVGITEDYPIDYLNGRNLVQPNVTPAHPFMRYNIYRYNRHHLYIRPDTLGEWFNMNRSFPIVTYPVCSTGSNNNFPNVMWLNREIGDDTLLVENRTAAWTCIYDAERYIGVDERSDYYEYPNSITSRTIPGIYSREDNYGSTSGTTIFVVRSDTNNIVLTNTPTYSYMKDTSDWVRCCEGASLSKPGKPTKTESNDNILTKYQRKVSGFNIYPNPTNNGNTNVIVVYPAVPDPNSEVSVFDMMGRKIFSKTFSEDRNNDMSHYRLTFGSDIIHSGTYIVTLKNGPNVYKKTLIIQK